MKEKCPKCGGEVDATDIGVHRQIVRITECKKCGERFGKIVLDLEPYK